MFIGREAELAFLNRKYQAEGGQLIVLYGRRRVGKTETLREFCREKPHVFFSCTQTTDRVQLAKFSTVMLREKIPASRYLAEFSDWQQAFSSVAELPYGEKKKILIVDEFPYMCKGNKSIPSILQNLWDEKLKEENVMIVLCGSAMSFIEKDLLAEKNPLYGRATGIYKMTEMGFYDAVRFFSDYSPRDKIMAYAILGGVPHYLRQFQPERSVEENIRQNILSKGCILYSEVEFLIHQELREPQIYNSIIEAVALGNTRLNDISQKSLVGDTSKTSIYLRNLMELGIIKREFSVDAGIREQANSGRGTYRVADNFFRFWYAFGFSSLSQLEDGDVEGVYRYMIEPELQKFASLTFETVCGEFVRRQQRENRLPFRCARIGRWFGKTTIRDARAESGLRTAETEIDLLGVNRDASKYLIGECKFKNRPFSYTEYLDTRAKLHTQQKRSEFYYALFSKSGFEERVEEEAAKDPHIRLYSLEEIVEGN